MSTKLLIAATIEENYCNTQVNSHPFGGPWRPHINEVFPDWQGMVYGLLTIVYDNEVMQSNLLGPLLFLIYINDVTEGIESDIFLFADDTSIFRSGKNNQILAQQINSDLNKISLWAKKWKQGDHGFFNVKK